MFKKVNPVKSVKPSTKCVLNRVNPKMNLPKLEEEILNFWDKEKIFEKSIENRSNAEDYVFYDGPPFATGTPHYGHIVGSTMKDVVPRFWTMKGKKVERKWGWDCHGLPIENIAEKELGIKSKKQIEEKVGVEKFNEFCRTKILEYVDEWRQVIRRLGRWADMDNAYKTMDLGYMESVWWVFKQLWDKDLIYKSYRSMHICPRCETTLSQSEVAEGYKDVKDLSVVAKFELVDAPGTYVLAWTTTPWTLIGNVVLAIGKDIKYKRVKVKDENRKESILILAADRIKEMVKTEFEDLGEIKTKDLIGKKYKPLFDYYSNDEKIKNRENGWQIVEADFVNTEEGTGVVHIAPAFGEDDMKLGQKLDLPFVQHIGMDGVIKEEAGEFAGMNVKPQDDNTKTDVEIIKYLAKKELLFSKEKYEHSYPHCWRCDTPLLNYATSSWFVAVEKIKDKALQEAKDINWSPAHIKNGRFGNWLEGARDWSISRQRYWASVMPIWQCDKCKRLEVFGSKDELEEASGVKANDLHKHVVDKIVYSCKKCDGEMKRIPDVLDTWFDSGSMPYAQMEYPKKNKEKFEANFPAEFIAEGDDQTRAWFYYLHILSTAIFEKPAYKNVIVNGIVLAEDGKKMSKRLQNYPNPSKMFDKYGADVMRMYLMSSPIVSAENLNFSESEMSKISRGLFRMLWNSYYFFVLYASIDKVEPTKNVSPGNNNILDKWIVSELNSLILEVDNHMTKYDLMHATRAFDKFVDNLSNWYIRRSRKRFWKSENDYDKDDAYKTLHYILIELSKTIAPFAPFISEEMYKNLAGEESVHLEDYPKGNKVFVDEKLKDEMKRTREIVESGLKSRSEKGIKVRQPLATLTYFGKKIDRELESIIAEEINVKEVKNSLEKDIGVELDFELTEELEIEGIAREIIRAIQSTRKKKVFHVEDRIILYYEAHDNNLIKAIEDNKDLISKEVLAIKMIARAKLQDIDEKLSLGDSVISFKIRREGK